MALISTAWVSFFTLSNVCMFQLFISTTWKYEDSTTFLWSLILNGSTYSSPWIHLQRTFEIPLCTLEIMIHICLSTTQLLSQYSLKLYQLALLIIPVLCFVGSLATCTIINSLPNQVTCITLSGWRLFILDHLSDIHVYCINTSRHLASLSLADLGLASGCAISRIWCSCVCLLHVLCMDGNEQKLVCFDLLQNKQIWKDWFFCIYGTWSDK